MKRNLLCLMMSLLMLIPALAGAEIVTLPLDFSAGMKPLGD